MTIAAFLAICIQTAVLADAALDAEAILADMGDEQMRDLTAASWQPLGTETMGEQAGAPGHEPTLLEPDGKNDAVNRNLPIEFPGKNEYVRTLHAPWTGWEFLNVKLTFPDDFPETTEIVVFTRDWDYYWHQIRIPFPAHRERNQLTFKLPLAGPEAEKRWVPVGHQRPWHGLQRNRVRFLGLKFDLQRGASAEYRGEVGVAGLWLTGRSEAGAGMVVEGLGVTPGQPVVGEVCEVSFKLRGIALSNPFDRDDISVTAEVVGPGGTRETVFGFYYEGFILKPASIKSSLVPYGHPQFKVRYTPQRPGRYKLQLKVKRGQEEIVAPDLTFDAAPPAQEFKGYLRVDDSDPQFMSFSNGDVFNGIGLNVRATYDVRYEQLVPFTTYQDEGLEMYRRLFRKYAAAGINVVEVWMCSWWLALEWIEDAPGNHGVGHMNQHRAWMLDELLRMAEDHGIYVILVLNNHGKVSTFCDQEWDRNPFNEINGGFLKSPEEFYTDERARHAFRRYAAYVVARWGYSPNLLMWKLFSEINLTGTGGGWYKAPAVANWHQEMAAYVKEIDPVQHPVTTHWSTNFHVINDAIADLPELDILTTDAYAGTTQAVMGLIDGSARYAKRKAKPLIITEYGGSPMGDSIGNLVKQVHLANWKGWFHQFAVTPMLWWFVLVDEQELYPYYRALSEFVDGEDPRGMVARMQELPNSSIVIHTLEGTDRTFIWGYDKAYYYSPEENLQPERFVDLHVDVTGLQAGAYEVEYWDCHSGKVKRRDQVQVEDNQPVLPLIPPAFEKDFALKIFRVDQQLAGGEG